MSEESNQQESTIQDRKYHLKYDSFTAQFADHVILNGTNGGIVLDFASTSVNEPDGSSTIPVHTRIAMTNNGAAQLYRLLNGMFTQASSTAGEVETAEETESNDSE